MDEFRNAVNVKSFAQCQKNAADENQRRFFSLRAMGAL